jgi:hypothetical protein
MSNLYGWLTYDHHAGEVTRTAHREISSVVKTWRGQVRVYLAKDGDCLVTVRNLHGGETVTLFRGNIDEMWQQDEPRPTVTVELEEGLVQIDAPEWLNMVYIDRDSEEEADATPE